MATNTRIEWADATINPLVGCSKVSPACDNCYAERMAARMVHNPAVAHRYAGTVDAHGKWTGKINYVTSQMKKALRWRKPQRIFVGSMSDLFHPSVPDEHLDQVFAYMLASHTLANCANHTFMLLTKRPDRMREYLSAGPSALIERWAKAGDGWIILDNEDVCFSETIESIASWGPQLDYRPWAYTHQLFPLPNVWLGTTVEDQARADERVPELLATPGALHFVSCEPLLGPVDLSPWLEEILHEDEVGVENGNQTLPMELGMPCMHDPWIFGLRWVIAGGETGPGARPSHPDWFRSLRDQCKAHDVPFFFKSWGQWSNTNAGLVACYNLDAYGWWTEKGFAPHGVGSIFENQMCMFNVGKARSGRLLDGVEHNAIPAGRG
ncbi:phage Gp37/Gp68 family protein [Nitratidesulfovibrio liaohensis]|uniref:Phage Gp37/Gp68 family protein n=1 Tax=Nitratidesulfovibrio liaohensis TaxID=2604158 RepID=A0ABY9R0S6_9BACT|nr:phage Gp37/Gp68 family protein [Nitratidesulfovibrio liaohensis]WMW64364.1 phage Gp37/Gp68 family protein [Nitratidesulfovibrio liaohensis]